MGKNLNVARAVIAGAGTFIQAHQSHSEIIGTRLTTRRDALKIRQTLSVPLLETAVEELFGQSTEEVEGWWNRFRASRANSKLKAEIEADVEAARSNLADANHRAALLLTKHLPAAALSEDNELLLVALARFIESELGSEFGEAVSQLPAFREVLSRYYQLKHERDRELAERNKTREISIDDLLTAPFGDHVSLELLEGPARRRVLIMAAAMARPGFMQTRPRRLFVPHMSISRSASKAPQQALDKPPSTKRMAVRNPTPIPAVEHRRTKAVKPERRERPPAPKRPPAQRERNPRPVDRSLGIGRDTLGL